ncbi:MAG TPA: serine/threonine-protein kinase [Mycobacteriales bacterium]
MTVPDRLPLPDEPELDAPGRLVAGRYRLSRVLATGGMGQVWLGRDEVAEQPVAVKVLRAEYAAEPAFVERFRAEARTARLLDHPHVATVIDYGEQTGPHGEPTGAYLVMELVDGEPLSAILRREGPLDQRRVLDLLAQAGSALQAAHDAGIVHRDVKPANILVTRDDQVKITDFGIARATGALSLTRTGTVLGTAHYLSPEQVQGRSASPASDLYALGVVAYECLAGRRPFVADSPLEVALAHQRDPVPSLPDHVHPAVARLVHRALAKDPAGRHRSAGAFGRTAAGIADTLFAPGVPAAQQAAVSMPTRRPPAERPRRAPSGRRPTGRAEVRSNRPTLRLPLVVLGALVVAAVVVAVIGGTHERRAPTTQPVATRTPAVAASAGGLAVDPAAYAGQPADNVVVELQRLGLDPSLSSVEQAGTPGTVVTIVSVGGAPLPAVVPKGTRVVVQEVGAS